MGVDAIAAEIGREPRQVYYMLSAGSLPAAKKVGGRWVVSRRQLWAFFGAKRPGSPKRAITFMSRIQSRPDTVMSVAQVRAARGLLDWSLPRLAAEAGLEAEALELFEAGRAELSEADARVVSSALYVAGVIPIPADLAGEGVRLRYASVRNWRTSFAAPHDDLPGWLPLAAEVRSAAGRDAIERPGPQQRCC